MDRIIRILWWVLFAGFCVSMLTWMPVAWADVFNNGLTLSIVLLSITLITGMAGQLSLCQATLAGVGAFTAAQLANHLGLNLFVGGLVGAALAAVVAVVLALLSLRLRGLGLALMTLAAALLFDTTFFNETYDHRRPEGISLQSKWLGTSAFFNFNGHAMFLLVHGVLDRRSRHRPPGAQGNGGPQPGRHAGERDGDGRARRQPHLAAHRRVRPLGRHRRHRWACSTAWSSRSSIPTDWNADFSLVLVVLVVTTSVTTVEGAIQAGIGFFVTEQILTTILPARIGGPSLTVVLFAFGALTYAQHPEGVLEFQKRKATARFERLFFLARGGRPRSSAARAISTSSANG